MTATEIQPATLGYDEAATYVGVSRRTLERWVSDGSLRCVRKGGVVRFRVVTLDKFLEDQESAGAKVHRLRVPR